MLAQENARMLSISGEGDSADYDYAGGAGASLWAGVTYAYYSETARLDTADGQLNRTSADFLLVDDLPIDPAVGISVTFEYEGVQQTRRVTEVGHRPSIPGIPHTHKLYLESV